MGNFVHLKDVAALTRGFRRIAAALAVLSLASCLSGPFSGPSAGASASAAGLLQGIRAAHGLRPLAADRELENAALRQARYMAGAGTMNHTTGYGRDFASRMSNTETNGAAAENIARGRMSLDRLFEMWMNSEGHRRNMLDPRFSRFGLASAGEGSDRYWALVLGR
jgi:uncharacterized protein YkwD